VGHCLIKDVIRIGAPRGSGHAVNPDETPDESRRLAIAVAVGCAFVGFTLRYLAREHATIDAVHYLIPWYAFARDHGIGGLGEAFTNYTPFYSYLLLITAQFDWFGQPLSLVKVISAVFEFGCAIVVAQIVWRATKAPLRASLAFCGVWLAPTVIFNGAVWGQADSIWTFFTLVSVSLFMQDRNGVLPFAVAFSVKAQACSWGHSCWA
jgi:Gpi18-like mannosyltransferase